MLIHHSLGLKLINVLETRGGIKDTLIKHSKYAII